MSEKAKVSVIIPLYRGKDSIMPCLHFLKKQEGVDIEIILVDNGCPQDTGIWASKYLRETAKDTNWKLIDLPHNAGFAAGSNAAYAQATGDFICFMNQDVRVDYDFLKILIGRLQAHPDWCGACGTLYRWKSETNNGELEIDSTGHEIYRSRIVKNRGVGLKVRHRKDFIFREGPVFGMSAACSVYRREALEQVREEEGPFDPDYFSYFEDVDLDYRMNRAGWVHGYVPEAVGFHELAASGGRREILIKIRAYGNRRRLLLKHETFQSMDPDLLPIVAQDVISMFRTLFTDPLVAIFGPLVFTMSLPSVMKRRNRLEEKLGVDRNWIWKWIKLDTFRLPGNSSKSGVLAD